MKWMFTIGMVLGVAFLSSCASRNKSSEPTKAPERLIGNGKDDHGCLTSAGYQWSELLNDCIRPFEKGIKLSSTKKENASYAAYLVFNADSSKVEVFMREMKKRPILKRSQSGEQTIWSNAKVKNLIVKRLNGQWTVLQDDRAIYTE